MIVIVRPLLLLLCLYVPPQPGLVQDRAVRALFADLLRLGGYGRWDTERAAFLVRTDDGEYRCLLWPATREFHHERFSGRIPEGTVAVVHTHPEATPGGSVGDIMTAQALRLPMFVLTRNHIYQVTSSGGNEEVVRVPMWALPLLGERHCEDFRVGQAPHGSVQRLRRVGRM